MNTCDACDSNIAVHHYKGDFAVPEGVFCRSCMAQCHKHGRSNRECGCPFEVHCVDCDDVLATIKPGDPEPPLRCAECHRASEEVPSPCSTCGQDKNGGVLPVIPTKIVSGWYPDWCPECTNQVSATQFSAT